MHWSIFPPLLDGTLREHYLLLFGIAGAIALVVGFSSAWIGAYFGARRAARRALRDAGSPGPTLATPRLEELVRSIDAIALEVERISEGQRFATKLLVERGGTPATPPRRDHGVVTPH